ILSNFPAVVLKAYADDITIIAKQDCLLPQIQKFIEEKAALFGMRVNQKKSCVLPLSKLPPPTILQHWNSPLVNEYRYLGIILSKEISEKTIYMATLNKFKNRLTSAKAFGG